VATPQAEALWRSRLRIPPRAPTLDLVYHVLHPSGRLVKIGHSANLVTRLRTFELTHGNVTLLATEPGGLRREVVLHRRFWYLRRFGEWFAVDDLLLAHVLRLRSDRWTEVS
jgi:hypothetical protein